MAKNDGKFVATNCFLVKALLDTNVNLNCINLLFTIILPISLYSS